MQHHYDSPVPSKRLNTDLSIGLNNQNSSNRKKNEMDMNNKSYLASAGERVLFTEQHQFDVERKSNANKQLRFHTEAEQNLAILEK